MSAKEKHKKRMLDFWGNPENDFITRIAMHTDVLKISGPTFYAHFTPAEIQEIENEAFEERKKNSTKIRSEIYKALAAEAKKGNVKAAQEFLNRTEGKVTDKQEITGKDGKDLAPIINVTTTGNKR